MAAKKREKKDQLSETQLVIEEKMLAKNMHIRQRAVNEVAPMIGFNSQNLFKLH